MTSFTLYTLTHKGSYNKEQNALKTKLDSSEHAEARISDVKNQGYFVGAKIVNKATIFEKYSWKNLRRLDCC